jgi:DnaJ domain
VATGAAAADAVVRARALLGVEDGSTANELRAAYRRALLHTHPDLSPEGDATERTVELTRAYRLLVDQLKEVVERGAPPSMARSPAPRPPASPSSPPTASIAVVLLDDDTIGVAAPPSETLLLLVDTVNRLGDISYLDPSAGLVEAVVEFIEAPTSSVLLSLQGRATGMTEIFCTVEPLSGGEAPPSDAVTRLLLHTLLEVVGQSS